MYISLLEKPFTRTIIFNIWFHNPIYVSSISLSIFILCDVFLLCDFFLLLSIFAVAFYFILKVHRRLIHTIYNGIWYYCRYTAKLLVSIKILLWYFIRAFVVYTYSFRIYYIYLLYSRCYAPLLVFIVLVQASDSYCTMIYYYIYSYFSHSVVFHAMAMDHFRFNVFTTRIRISIMQLRRISHVCRLTFAVLLRISMEFSMSTSNLCLLCWSNKTNMVLMMH